MLVTRDVSLIASILTDKSGAVIAYPTETFYGLGSRISDCAAMARIVQIKGREASKGMIVLACDMDMISSIAEIDSRQRALLESFWPGPLSALLQARGDIEPLLAPGGKIALRISPHPLAISLVQRVGPITSTSANISGRPPACTAEEIARQGLSIDGILDGGETPGGRPSTLIDLTHWPPVCLREGTIPFEDIIKVYSIMS
jgi:L-threonylcarbamoyladenylate synthase